MASISSISSSSEVYQNSASSNANQIKNDFKALGTALQSGDLTDAQQAMASLQKDAPDLFKSSGNSSQNNPLTTLATDLQNGNLASAQSDFATLQQQAQKGGHHHHHHRSSQTSVNAAGATPTIDPSGTTGTQINTLA